MTLQVGAFPGAALALVLDCACVCVCLSLWLSLSLTHTLSHTQVGALPGAALVLALAYWMLRTVAQPAGCVCLDYRSPYRGTSLIRNTPP